MSARRLFGVETEYAVTAIDRAGSVWAPATFSTKLVDAARRHLVHLRATADAGLFLANGSRLYVDYGDHPEISSPECLNPWDAVRYARAGDRIMAQLAQQVEREHALSETIVRTGNVDYSGSAATWGAHESYCHRAQPAVLQRRLVPHLVSRTIYTGAGGFNPFSPGLEFVLSPRALHLMHVVSDASTSQRGIIHTRNEPLAARGYFRQHVLCGETLRSDLAAWLRVGVTALIVAMIEANVPCGDDVELESPVDALKAFARDVTCNHLVKMANGRPMTAIQIQRRYLERAIEHLEAPWMPAWALTVCEEWDDILRRLEHGPEGAATRLDWAIKLAIFRDRVRRQGFDWDALPAWTKVAHFAEMSAENADRPMVAWSETARSVPAIAEKYGLKWTDKDRFDALGQELLEGDVRFGQLGPSSVFDALDRAGVLDHHVPGVDRIDEAVEHPPAEGRAHVRGETIRRLATQAGRYSCMWDYILDHETDRSLDLSDPFVEQATWHAPPSATTRESPPPAAAERASRIRTRAPATPTSRPADGLARPNPTLASSGPSPQDLEGHAPPIPSMERQTPLFPRLIARLRGRRSNDSEQFWADGLDE